MRNFLSMLTRSPEDGTGSAPAPQPEGSAETGLVVDMSNVGAQPEGAQPEADPGRQPDKQTRTAEARTKGLFPQEKQTQPDALTKDPDPEARPDWLPEKFWNAKDKAPNAEAMAKSYTELEKELGTLKRAKSVGGEVPESADDYFKDAPIQLPESVNRISLEPDDPGIKAWAKACQKHGIGKDAARALAVDMFVSMNDFMPEPMDPELERQALGKEGPATVEALWTWADTLEQRGALSEDDVDVFADMMGTAKGVKFLAKLRGMTGLEPIPLGMANGEKAMSAAEWQTAYSEAIKKGDYKEQARLDAIGERINGTHAAGTSRSGSIGYSG